MAKSQIIVKRECDQAMARSKGIIGSRHTNIRRCNGECSRCMACIETDSNGEREHVRFKEKRE